MSSRFAYVLVGALLILIVVGALLFSLQESPSRPAPTPSPTPTPTPGETPTTPVPSPTPTPERKYSVVIATGGVGGVYFVYGATVAGLLSNLTGIQATSIQTAASVDNLLLIRDKTDVEKGVIYCAMSLPEVAYLAFTGRHERFAERPAPIAILWAAYPNFLHVVTTADSGIKSLSDLKGKRVSTGAPGSGTEVEALQILRLIGIEPSRDFSKWERLGVAESANALRDGAIDAFFWSGGLPTSSIVELSRTLAARGKQLYLVPIDEATANKFAAAFPGLAARGTIARTVYGTAEDTPTLSFWNVFVCHKDTPPEVAYTITKVVFENLPTLHRAVAAARDTRLENALLLYGGVMPYHRGAIAYYLEVGALKR
ncbi:MAG: TAXI family TRAP transporter solute-binding subunit [Acidilobaceae archaeon]|nr:TAXI family TRAP transporter solute-binding subunit [Acidilobaceae archaeon]